MGEGGGPDQGTLTGLLHARALRLEDESHDGRDHQQHREGELQHEHLARNAGDLQQRAEVWSRGA
ncbi:hypothetical protein Scani_80250 [Streptomyces caniferus]|uniref:Uncharacterized protein n=1 Tax=Streptomyces caniferus TaxID=285557 RepID=A0A640SKI0_9ACTN|nr:hypothetical protein Scani_80250 [Streptomyces caniferus]